jgi:hypothetical protein
VRELRGRLVEAGVELIGFDDESDPASLKCLAPDGWHVEVSREP